MEQFESLNSNGSQPNIVSAQQPKTATNYIKRWQKFFRLHKQQPITVTIPSNAAMGMESQAYLLLIERIDGLARPSSPDLQLAVRVVANMFMDGEETVMQGTQTKQSNKCFFGRTYESPFINVAFTPDGMNYEHHPINIYYHTKWLPQNCPVTIVIEVQVNELSGGMSQRRQTVGWIQVPACVMMQAPSRINVKKGSARILLNQQKPIVEPSQNNVILELVHSGAFQSCSYLVPENTLVGTGDEIPGVKQNFIQFSQSPQSEIIELTQSFSVFLSNVQIHIPDQLEQEINKQVLKFRSQKYKVAEGSRGDVQFTSKKLVVFYHNGWNVVNSRGMQNTMSLGDSKQAISEMVEGRQMAFKLLEYSGQIDVNNITSENPNSENNFGILILQLEYEATFQVPNMPKQPMQVFVGYIPIYLNDKIGMQSEKIEEEFILGPGNTVTGRPLSCFSQEHYLIKLTATLNIQGTAYQGVQQVQNTQGGQQGQYNQQNQQNYQQNGQFDVQAQNKIREIEQQMSVLKNENERLKRAQRDNHNQSSTSFVDQTPYQQSKELDYLQVVEQLREDNRVNNLNSSKQFEGFEKLLRQQASSSTGFGGSRSGAIYQGPQSRDMYDKVNTLFDQTNMAKYQPIENTQYPQPTSTLRNVSKADTAFLAHAGIAGLLDGDPVDSDSTDQQLEARALKVEMQDGLQDTMIVIQPLAIKIFLQDEEMQDLKQLGFMVPKNLYLTIHFYDQPQFQTPNLVLESGDDNKALLFHLRHNTPLRVLTQDQQTHNTKFSIDTSSTRYNNLQMDFAAYLFRKCLLIDVWDADSKLLFGSMKIPMRGLLRQGRQSQHMLKEIDILDTNFKRIKGSLQVLIKNNGRQASATNISHKDARIMTMAETMANKPVKLKNKIVSESPISGQKVRLSTTVLPEKTQEDRLNSRINKLKMSNLSIIHQVDLAPSKKVAVKKLNEVVKYKEIKKPDMVSRIVQDFLSTEKILNSFFGRTEIVPFHFKNTTALKLIYQVMINDPDSPFLQTPEFQLITDPVEWKYWCQLKGYPEPYAFDMIKYEESQQRRVHYFFLEGGEEIILLFRFLSFRIVDVNLQSEPDAVRIAQSKGKDYIQQFTYQRHIQVYFTRRDGNTLITEFRIMIEPHMQVVDHVLRFYERNNRQTKIRLPPLYTFSQPPQKKPIIYVTDPSVVVEWGNDNDEIKLCLKVGDVRSVTQFNVLAYHDNYCNELVGNWHIEVHSLAGFDLEVPMGQNIMSRLTLPCDVTRVVRLFSSQIGTLTFPEQYQKQFSLVPGKINLIEYNVRSVQENAQAIQINCVDFNSQELIYSWLAKITTIPQVPSATYETKCQEGQEGTQKLSYVNRTNQAAKFLFTTSHPNYIQIINYSQQIGPMEKGDIKLRILPKIGVQQIDTKIFITDQEERIFDTILLKVYYTYNRQ